MQSWAPVDSEVEIIPPKTRFRTGSRSAANWGRVHLRQTVNLTESAPVAIALGHSVYDATGRPGQPGYAVPTRLRTYA
jgi:hypothetical protein